jgi:hypothetical protein
MSRFEQLLARHDLAQNLSRLQRKLVLALLCLSGLFFCSGQFGMSFVIVAGAVLMVANKTLPKDATPTTAPAPLLDVRHRPAPELVVGFDAFMRPARDLLRRVPQDRRAVTMVALLEAMEVFADSPMLTAIEHHDVRTAVRNRELPRLTKEADDLFAHGATFVRNVQADTAQGRFLSVRLCLPDGTDITFHWNVQVFGGTYVYRIDQTQATGR